MKHPLKGPQALVDLSLYGPSRAVLTGNPGNVQPCHRERSEAILPCRKMLFLMQKACYDYQTDCFLALAARPPRNDMPEIRPRLLHKKTKNILSCRPAGVHLTPLIRRSSIHGHVQDTRRHSPLGRGAHIGREKRGAPHHRGEPAGRRRDRSQECARPQGHTNHPTGDRVPGRELQFRYGEKHAQDQGQHDPQRGGAL